MRCRHIRVHQCVAPSNHELHAFEDSGEYVGVINADASDMPREILALRARVVGLEAIAAIAKQLDHCLHPTPYSRGEGGGMGSTLRDYDGPDIFVLKERLREAVAAYFVPSPGKDK